MLKDNIDLILVNFCGFSNSIMGPLTKNVVTNVLFPNTFKTSVILLDLR